jgi:hypothetical protein
MAASPCLAQQLSVPADSVSSYLCKNWEMSYVLMGETKIYGKGGSPMMNFGFKQDKTFWISTTNDESKRQGHWLYDEGNKNIKLIVNGKSEMRVVNLQAEELMVRGDTKVGTPDRPIDLKIVFKAKTE